MRIKTKEQSKKRGRNYVEITIRSQTQIFGVQLLFTQVCRTLPVPHCTKRAPNFWELILILDLKKFTCVLANWSQLQTQAHYVEITWLDSVSQMGSFICTKSRLRHLMYVLILLFGGGFHGLKQAYLGLIMLLHKQ